ncbi:CPBP family intramembrane glutamic endopeptidase [Haladaptatus salinisoli]|uniref:CPBP family intramembrane glutamic endopeptidase n=1 Tax=Haladaptatus salinisoli TaxID=2884876 RepID=UPI001D0BC5F6|nr:type II CAAX endopeptidase family protein [Haladaptatus salinisoli]
MTRVTEALRAVGVGLGLAIVAIFGSFALVLGASRALALGGVSVRGDPELRIALSLLLVQGVTFGGISLLYLRLRGREYVRVRVPTVNDGKWMLGGVLAMLAAMFAVVSILGALGIHSAQNEVVRLGVDDPRVFLLLIPCAFLIIGPGEELLFRGVIQSRLRDAFSPAIAIGLASAIFASAHALSLVGAFQARVATIASLFVVSLVLGIAYERTENLAVNAFIHGCYDASLFLLAYLAIR